MSPLYNPSSGGTVTDATITTSDITTNDVSSSKHGWMSKLPGGSTKYYREDGTWVVGTVGAASKATASGTVTVTGSLQDITGATQSLAAGTYVIVGAFYAKVNNSLNDRTFEGHLDVNGSDQTDIASVVFGTLANDIVSATQTWVVTLASTQTVKLRTKYSGGTTGDFTTQTTCTITAIQAGTSVTLLTTATNQLGSDTTATNANTYYDGPSLVTTGTQLLIGSVCVDGNGNSTRATAKLWDGTTVVSSGEANLDNGVGSQAQITLVGFVTASATYKVSVAFNSTGSKIRAAAPDNGVGNNASTLIALKVG